MSEQNTEPPVKVIFRTFRDGNDVIALFPELPGDMDAWSTCMSYVHVGQHSAADVRTIYGRTRLATPEEYTPLLQELTQIIGYTLRICHRFTRSDFLKRREACKPPSRK